MRLVFFLFLVFLFVFCFFFLSSFAELLLLMNDDDDDDDKLSEFLWITSMFLEEKLHTLKTVTIIYLDFHVF